MGAVSWFFCGFLTVGWREADKAVLSEVYCRWTERNGSAGGYKLVYDGEAMRNVIFTLSVLLASQRAVAQDDTPDNVLSDIFTAQHECDALMPQLDAAMSPQFSRKYVPRSENYRVPCGTALTN